jgi:hypothetical protein
VLKSALGCWVTPVDPRKPLAKPFGEDFAQAAVQLSRRQPGAAAAPDYPAVESDGPHRVGTMPRHRLAGTVIGNAPFGLAVRQLCGLAIRNCRVEFSCIQETEQVP